MPSRPMRATNRITAHSSCTCAAAPSSGASTTASPVAQPLRTSDSATHAMSALVAAIVDNAGTRCRGPSPAGGNGLGCPGSGVPKPSRLTYSSASMTGTKAWRPGTTRRIVCVRMSVGTRTVVGSSTSTTSLSCGIASNAAATAPTHGAISTSPPPFSRRRRWRAPPAASAAAAATASRSRCSSLAARSSPARAARRAVTASAPSPAPSSGDSAVTANAPPAMRVALAAMAASSVCRPPPDSAAGPTSCSSTMAARSAGSARGSSSSSAAAAAATKEA
mmetsp:Transcript_25059/g.87383  ORF Transcript_25059/g.87383 Transcript_25059/m.87383 type:complete len:278 (+) Transcript_25059:1474-2307(+)